jgi:hypothetical protein
MTTISSSYAQVDYTSRRGRLQSELNQQISSGAIKSSDKDAISSALDEPDSTLSSGSSSSSNSVGGTDSSDTRSKVSDLVASQVKSGKLTSDQGKELMQILDNVARPDGSGGSGSFGSGSSSSSDTDDLLASFLKQIKSSMSQATSYNADGSSSASSMSVSLLFNYKA